MKNIVKELRIKYGWSQKDLREKLGWTQPDVSRGERGITGLSERKIKQLAEVFGVSVAVILGESSDINIISKENHKGAKNQKDIQSAKVMAEMAINEAISGKKAPKEIVKDTLDIMNSVIYGSLQSGKILSREKLVKIASTLIAIDD